MGPGERAEPGRERPCGVLPERWSPHRPPAPLQFRSQAGYALYLRHAGEVSCTNSKERAEAATRRKQLHKTQLAAPLEAQSQVSPTWLRRATGSQSEASSTWGRGHSLPHSPPSPIPRGVARARAERSQRGRREQVGTAERGRTQGRGLFGTGGFQSQAKVESGPRAEERGRRQTAYCSIKSCSRREEAGNSTSGRVTSQAWGGQVAPVPLRD